MSETGFQIFHQAYAVGAELLYALCLTLFLYPFMGEREHRRKKGAAVFCVYLLTSLFLSRIAAPQGSFILVLLLFLTAASKALELGKHMAFLLGLLYWNAKISSGLMAESLFFIGEELVPAPTEPPEAVYLRTTVLLTLLLLSHLVLFIIMLYALLRRIKRRMPGGTFSPERGSGNPFPDMSERNSNGRFSDVPGQFLPSGLPGLCYMSLIPAAGILFGQMIAGLLYEIKDGQLLQLYERHPAFLAVVPLLALLFYMGGYLTILFQQEMAVLREEQAAAFVERQQVQAIRARIQEAEQFYSQIRRIRHETRGHLNNIKGMLHNGEYACAEDYIFRMDESMGGFELTLRTGNPVTDVIVNDKRQQCEDQGIPFQTDFHYPDSGSFDAFDVGIVLQNLLQNALEACEKISEGERFISLAGRRKGRFLLIEVKNSFAGDLVFGADGLPVTDKKTDVSMHGIGLSSVRRIAEKYMGEMEVCPENQVFRVTVMVQEKS
nr:ATP-binding protein [uncultured Schaedlerella sp.]